MKVFAKPVSSPGRTDHEFWFPRNKSSSRGSRSRGNPKFLHKINASSEEPSSPKVTCIGQVRSRRRRSNKKRTTAAFRRCRWLRKLKPKCFRRVWRRSLSFFRCENDGKSKKLQESKRIIEADQRNEYRKREIEDVIVNDNEILMSKSPPRNAFLLTRSRSALYRSSSSVRINWDITMEKRGEERVDDEIEEEIEAINGDFVMENGEDEGFINGVEEFKAKPLNLSRCKSVPARTGDKSSEFRFITR